MPAAWSPIAIPSSFQNGRRIFCEDPLDEIWRRIARLGTLEEAQRLCSERMLPRDRPRVVSARIRQGVELRNSFRTSSLLTSPLLLYYSFQNLARAFVGLSEKQEPAGSHGLEFRPRGRQLLDAEAQISESGTFPALSKVFGNAGAVGSRISLRQALASLPELKNVDRVIGASRVATVSVTAFFNREAPMQLRLSLPSVAPGELRARIAALFPDLACAAVATEIDGVFSIDVDPGNAGTEVGNHLVQWLLPDLRVRQDAVWYCLRGDDGVPNLPRLAYYFVAAYILSNVVRYEPTLVANLNPDSSELGWTLREFLNAADRYFPQLLLSMGEKHPLLFG